MVSFAQGNLAAACNNASDFNLVIFFGGVLIVFVWRRGGGVRLEMVSLPYLSGVLLWPESFCFSDPEGYFWVLIPRMCLPIYVVTSMAALRWRTTAHPLSGLVIQDRIQTLGATVGGRLYWKVAWVQDSQSQHYNALVLLPAIAVMYSMLYNVA